MTPALEVRISRSKVTGLAAVLAILLPAFSVWMLGGVETREAFEALQSLNQGDRRCLICVMEYGPYRTLSVATVVSVDLLFGAAAVVGLIRAFGPPTLSVAADGTGRYVLPWRTRTFRISPTAMMAVDRRGLVFDRRWRRQPAAWPGSTSASAGPTTPPTG